MLFMKTAVEWLEEKLKQNCGSEFTELNKQIFDKAKEMEEKQILDAWKEGYDLAINGERLPKL